MAARASSNDGHLGHARSNVVRIKRDPPETGRDRAWITKRTADWLYRVIDVITDSRARNVRVRRATNYLCTLYTLFEH